MKTLVRFLVVMLAVAVLGTSPAAADGGFVVLVNQANPATSVSRSELKRLVTGGTKQWGSGAAVQLGVIAGEAPETAYLASLVDMSARDLLSRISEQVFKGELRKPVVLRGPGDCAAFARAAPGAMCVSAASVAVPAEAHVLQVH